MRAMFNIFATKVQIDAGIDWVCLTGSDMYINVPLPEKELGQIMAHPPESCRRPDRCVVTNVLTRHNIRYQGGGFCMRTPTALAVQRFLAIYSDRELDWLGSVSLVDLLLYAYICICLYFSVDLLCTFCLYLSLCVYLCVFYVTGRCSIL